MANSRNCDADPGTAGPRLGKGKNSYMTPMLKQALEATCVAATAAVSLRLVYNNPPIDTWKLILVFVPTFLITFMLVGLWFKQKSERK
jgi:hypothetical protein